MRSTGRSSSRCAARPARSPSARSRWPLRRSANCARPCTDCRSAKRWRTWSRRPTARAAPWARRSANSCAACWSDYDVLQVDPMQPAFRELAAPLLRSAVEAAPELTAAVLERNQELAEAGYHAQVHMEEQTSFVFLLENGKRLALRRNGDEYVLNGRRFTTQELADARGVAIAERDSPAGRAGFDAADGRLHRRARGDRVPGAIGGDLRASPGPDAGGGAANRIHHSGRAHRQAAWSATASDVTGSLPWRRGRCGTASPRGWFRPRWRTRPPKRPPRVEGVAGAPAA